VLIALQATPARAQQPWSTPDATTGNINNTNSGYVGIGTTSPQNALDVNGSLILRGNSTMANLSSVGPVFNAGYYAAGGYAFFQGFNYTTLVYIPLDIDASKVIINSNSGGNVGIGTTTPAAKLHVVGDGKVTGNLTVDGTGNITAAGTITGGTINAKYQDVAEWVPATKALPAGTVVTLDPTKSNHVEASSKAYDTRVAGVISEQPGITLGERGDNKVLVATTGRVRLKVDASNGPIEVGDLLVTSDVPGLAMKSQPVNLGGIQLHRPGTLVGKALEPLTKGRGEILVLDYRRRPDDATRGLQLSALSRRSQRHSQYRPDRCAYLFRDDRKLDA